MACYMSVWKGSVIVGDETLPHETFNTLVLSAEPGETGVKLTAAEDGTEFVLAAAEPLDQTIFQYGPFVMTNREEIQKTILDCMSPFCTIVNVLDIHLHIQIN
jgi:quercetin 2,3-dioxygenase